jgi:hypothetical protein
MHAFPHGAQSYDLFYVFSKHWLFMRTSAAMRVLIAFDKFKDALNAEEACEVVARFFRKIPSAPDLDLCPLSDGGEGFSRILTKAAGGTLYRHKVTGPLGKNVEGEFGLVSWKGLAPVVRSRLRIPPGREGVIGLVDMASVVFRLWACRPGITKARRWRLSRPIVGMGWVKSRASCLPAFPGSGWRVT